MIPFSGWPPRPGTRAPPVSRRGSGGPPGPEPLAPPAASYAEERGFPPYPHQLGPAESAAVFSADLGDVLRGAPVLPQQDAGCPLVDPGTIALKADAIAAKRMSAISRIT